MLVYIDSDYKCHTNDDGTMQEIEDNFFDGKCKFFIEGYRYVPENVTWTRSDGEQFTGTMIAPWKDYAVLQAAQLEYVEDILNQILEVYEDGEDTIRPTAAEGEV